MSILKEIFEITTLICIIIAAFFSLYFVVTWLLPVESNYDKDCLTNIADDFCDKQSCKLSGVYLESESPFGLAITDKFCIFNPDTRDKKCHSFQRFELKQCELPQEGKR